MREHIWLILKFAIILSSTFSLALTYTSVLPNVAKFIIQYNPHLLEIIKYIV